MASGHLWINEKRYNKSGRVGGKTLIGNWQEEQRLELDVGLEAGSIVDTNRKGAESTPFLISSLTKNDRVMETEPEQRAQYNQSNSDVALLRPPKLGVRSQLRAQAILEEAKRLVVEEEKARQRAEQPQAKSAAKEMAEKTGVVGPPVRTVDPTKRHEYAADRPVTLYTGDPTTGSRMHGVPGSTSVAPGAPNPFSKNSGFTMDKYVYAMSRA